MKQPGNFLGQPDLTKLDIQEVIIYTSEPSSNIETTEIAVKILKSNYAKFDLYKVDISAVQIDIDQHRKL